jgi:hypothetical protein
MQRNDSGGIIISCDFCGTDWDAYDETYANPMVEGHHGSVICLTCTKRALEEMTPPGVPYRCAMCLREGLDADRPRWIHPAPAPSPGLNPGAIVCRACIRQAARRFHKDPDVQWQWSEITRDVRAGLDD